MESNINGNSGDDSNEQQQKQHLTLSEVESLCHRALSASGLNSAATDAITQVVTAAERDGCHSHGLFRIPGYCKALLAGKVDGTAQPKVLTSNKNNSNIGVVKVDANGGFAPPAILAGREDAIAKARSNGISCLMIRNSFHFAALWWEVESLAEEGIVSLAFVNSRSFVAHQPGGKKQLYGTNPMAFGFPRGTTTTGEQLPPLVWDQASAAMARGEIQICQRDGHVLPDGVAIDRHGQPTRSPTEALEGGAQLPFGGHKGTAIAMMVELLAAGLTGSNFSFEERTADDDDEEYEKYNPNGPTNHGELIILIDPIALGGEHTIQRCEKLFQQILEEEGSTARLPSTRRYANRLKTPSEGIYIPKSLHDEIVALSNNNE